MTTIRSADDDGGTPITPGAARDSAKHRDTNLIPETAPQGTEMSEREMNVSQDHAPPITAVTSGQTHTSGPWRAFIGHNGGHEVRGPGSHTIASVFHTPDGLGSANADLIAGAPALLTALERVYYEWDGEPEGMLHVQAAIAKARGR